MAAESNKTERRIERRYRVRVPVEFRCAALTCKGTLENISMAGARIEEVDERPSVETRLTLSVYLVSPCPVMVEAEVVRHTETGGFAVRFCNLDSRILQSFCRLLPQLGELVEK